MPSKTTAQTFGLFLALASIVAVAPFLWNRGTPAADRRAGIGPGELMPELDVQGWVNGEPVTRDALRGKVAVVHSWFLTCPYCHRSMPEIVRIHQEFADNPDVMFIGLTTDGRSDLANVERFLARYEVTWPNAYGAAGTIFGTGPELTGFKAEYFPGYWVIGRDGRVVWNRAMGDFDDLRAAIRSALAAG